MLSYFWLSCTGWGRALQVHAVEHLIGGVVGTHKLDKDHRPGGKPQRLPRATAHPSPIHRHLPLPVIDGCFDVVAVSTLI